MSEVEPPLGHYAIIFANGDLVDGPAVRQVLSELPMGPDGLLIAADGGARHALFLGLTPHLVIGDFDSLTEPELDQLASMGAELRRYPAHKDETDLELALLIAAARGANPIRVIGGIGDRLDQTLANVYLLALPQLRGHDVRLVSGKQTAWLVYPGETLISGQPGDTLSLLPLGGPVDDIRTAGLQYPLRGETLAFGPARGISNVLQSSPVHISFTHGTLLVIHTIGRA